MSKAFTSEETEAAEVVPSRPRLLPGEKRYLTREGEASLRQSLARLQAEQAALLQSATPEAATRRAAVERELQAVAGTIADATVVTPEPSDRAFFGAWVTLEDEGGRRTRYRIVGAEEADARRGFISVASPLARALLGKEEGDEAVVETPRGRVVYAISAVDY